MHSALLLRSKHGDFCAVSSRLFYPLASNASIFCSAPPLGCGSVHVLGGSFARFCVSENARVPLRYSGQPLHRKIIASRSPNTPLFCLSNWSFPNILTWYYDPYFASNASISGLMGNGTPRLMSAEKTPSCSYRRRHSSLRAPTRH